MGRAKVVLPERNEMGGSVMNGSHLNVITNQSHWGNYGQEKPLEIVCQYWRLSGLLERLYVNIGSPKAVAIMVLTQ